MAFTVRDFPNRTFQSIEEYEQATVLRKKVELSLEQKGSQEKGIVAQILPLPPETVERRLSIVEEKLEKIAQRVFRKKVEPVPGTNSEGVPTGLVLKGESKGSHFTLEVLEDNYLCSDGYIYQSLSGAALGVSGNRRSGWRFWRGPDGRSVGEIVGRFYPDDEIAQTLDAEM
jgi:hypothetical protein